MEPFATLSRRTGAVGGGLLLLGTGPVPREIAVTIRRADGARETLCRQAVGILPYQSEESD